MFCILPYRDKPKIRFKPVDSDKPWVEYQPEVAEDMNQTATERNEKFDLYIDGVRFITDNASIVKVSFKENMYLS